MAIPQPLNSPELSREEFQYNMLIRYGIFTLNLPTYCDGCGKKFAVPHSIACPKSGLVLAWHNNAAKEWGALAARALNISCISYKSKINIRTKQGNRNGARA